MPFFKSFPALAGLLLLGILFSAVGRGAETAGTPRFQNPLIRTGNSPKLQSNSFADFSFTVENPTAAPERLSYRILPQSSLANIFSGTIHIPAGTKMELRREIFVENAEKFSLEAFRKGKRLRKEMNDTAEGQIASHKERFLGYWNDDADLSPLSGLKDITFQERKISPVVYMNRTPFTATGLSTLQALVVLRPDFAACSNQQVEELLQYVANGGCLVFADPKGTARAAKTILKDLLPIHVISCGERRNDFITAFPGFSGKRPAAKTVDFLYFLPPDGNKGITTGQLESYPLLWEAPYGKGVVKVFAFLPEAENFPGVDKRFVSRLFSWILHAPERNSPAPYKEVLDLLTGFSVPGTGLIKGILGAYFLVLILLAVISHLKKRPVIFWGGSAVLALAGTFFILQQAKQRISHKEQLLAVLQVTPCMQNARSSAGNSLFSVKKVSNDIVGKKGELLLGFPPPPALNPYALSGSPLFTIPTPVEASWKSNGRSILASFHIPARSSRQYLTYGNSSHEFPSPLAAYSLHLGKKGLSFAGNAPLLLPGKLKEKAETAFLILPGKAVALELSGDWIQKDFSSPDRELLKDALTAALEESIWKSHRSAVSSPLLALTASPEQRKEAGKSSCLYQGKEVFLFPVTWKIASGELLLPPELFAIEPNPSSRLHMINGVFNKNMELMPDTELDLSFSLPLPLRGIQMDELVMKLERTGSRMVKLTPLLYEGRTPIAGIPREDGSFHFPVKGRKILDPVTNRGRLVLKGELDEEGKALTSGGMRSFTWGLRSLEFSGKGKRDGAPVTY